SPTLDLTARPARITGLASHPDGSRLASISADGYVGLWSWETGAQEHSFAAHLGPLHAVAWTSDGRGLALSGQGGIVLCDLDGERRHTLSAEGRLAASSLAIHGNLLACCGANGGVELWD